MENLSAPYVRWTANERHPDSPGISLELRGPEKLWLGSPYLFEVTLRRVDTKQQPCLFPWSPQIHGFTGWHLILLHHTSDGFDKIDIKIPASSLYPPNQDVKEDSPLLEHTQNRPTLWVDIFPDCYLSFLKPGETYTLLWPGGLHDTWAWGGKKPWEQKQVPIQETNLVLPGGAMISFLVEEGEKPLNASHGWPMQISPDGDQDIPPLFTARIECASTIPLQKGEISVTMHVTYQATSNHHNMPITFHISSLSFPQLYRWRGVWKEHLTDECGWAIWDDPDEEICPGDHEHFETLYPGQTWSWHMHEYLPYDRQVGDLFRYQSDPAEIDWWNWGTKEDHKSTRLTVPCFLGPRILKPSDNDGRPLIVVPAPSPVDIEVI